MNPQASEALDVAKRFISAFSKLDDDALCALLHEDAVCEAPFPVVAGEDRPGAARLAGPALFAHMHNMKNLMATVAFVNQVWRTTDDGLAIMEADGDMTYRNGRPYLNKYLMMFRTSEGRITWWREYYSPVITARSHGNSPDTLP